jgi:hypothetical protein
VAEGGVEYRCVWTLRTALERRVEAVTEVRKRVAPGWERERISRRRVGWGCGGDGEEGRAVVVVAGVMVRSGRGKGTADEVAGCGGGEGAGEVGDMKIWKGLGTGVVEGITVIEEVSLWSQDGKSGLSYICVYLLHSKEEEWLCALSFILIIHTFNHLRHADSILSSATYRGVSGGVEGSLVPVPLCFAGRGTLWSRQGSGVKMVSVGMARTPMRM